MPICSVNPMTAELLKTFPEESPAEIERKLTRADRAFREWRKTSYAQRGEVLRQVARQLRDDSRRHAELMTTEMGKPITQALAEVEKSALVCDWYAEHAEALLAGRTVPTEAKVGGVRHEPLGAILAVMPWNFPFWQVLRCAAPALMAGNVLLLKHASNVPQCALEIESVFREAGVPDGVFTTLLLGGPAAETVIADRRIAAITLTGSEAAGRRVAAAAGAALKKSVLELGGSDPCIILDDADLRAAAKIGAWSRLQNSGQSCIAAKRFIVLQRVAGEFISRLQTAMDALSIGDPRREETEIGPLAREDLRRDLHRQVERSRLAGARIQLGGFMPDTSGYFYPPTLLVDVTPDMPVAAEETFGPVAPVMIVKDETEAIALANATPYGLGASLWTTDPERAQRLIPEIEAGTVFVNGLVKSDPRLPFGGIKLSGYGRELAGEGIREFVNVKTVCLMG